MFYTNSSSQPEPPDALSTRALNASNAAAQAAQAAALSAAQSAQLAARSATQRLGPAAQGMGTSVRQGVYSARGWAAPRLETAADYCTTTMAPKVAGALRTTARQVRPAEPDNGRSMLRSVLSMSILGVAAVAAIGAIAALVRRQYKSTTETGTGSDVMDVGDSAEPGAVPGQAGAPASQSTSPTGAGVNGQTSPSGW